MTIYISFGVKSRSASWEYRCYNMWRVTACSRSTARWWCGCNTVPRSRHAIYSQLPRKTRNWRSRIEIRLLCTEAQNRRILYQKEKGITTINVFDHLARLELYIKLLYRIVITCSSVTVIKLDGFYRNYRSTRNMCQRRQGHSLK